MLGKNLLKTTIFVLILVALFVSISLVSLNIYDIDDFIVIHAEDVEYLEPQYPVTLTKTESEEGLHLQYRAFDAIPLKDVTCKLDADRTVYLGGQPLGISIREEGLIITAKSDVITKGGIVSPMKNENIKIGDILLSVNGVSVKSSSDIAKVLDEATGDLVLLSIKRNEDVFELKVQPAIDAVTSQKRLGLILKDEIAGIGTMTYVNPANGRYGALGHPIKDGETGNDFNHASGSIYRGNILGVVKGQKGKAGELSGIFSKQQNAIGTIDKNNDFGIFGSYTASAADLEKIVLGSKYTVKPGKAYIYTTINGAKPEKYEIEIIKSSYQSQAKAKGMVIRVTDPRLLEASGGIVQGMSGSPIIQDGKLIGAVTHVFINDPTKGYGMYIDWMIDN